MTWKKLAYIGIAFGLMFALGVFVGRVSTNQGNGHPSGRKKNDPLAALVEKMPDDEWVHYSGRGADVGVFRSKDLHMITGVGVHNPDNCTVYLNFHESGEISYVGILGHGRDIRNWSFRKDGSVESETIFPLNRSKGAGTRTVFNLDGSVERTQEVRYQRN